MIFESVDDVWIALLDKLTCDPKFAVKTGSRDGAVYGEIIGFKCAINPTNQDIILRNTRRKLSSAYLAAEALWYLSGQGDISLIKRYAPSYERFAPSGVAYGAYGPRIMPQIESLIERLKASALSRQAVIQIWEARDLRSTEPDLPCTLCHQYIVRNGKVHLIVTMRSNDVWLGFPYDVAAFMMMQRLVASALNIEVGLYHHQVGSMHLYDRNLIDARESLAVHTSRKPLSKVWKLDDTFTTMQIAVECERKMRTEGVCPPSYDTLGDMGKWLVGSCAQKLGVTLP